MIVQRRVLFNIFILPMYKVLITKLIYHHYYCFKLQQILAIAEGARCHIFNINDKWQQFVHLCLVPTICLKRDSVRTAICVMLSWIGILIYTNRNYRFLKLKVKIYLFVAHLYVWLSIVLNNIKLLVFLLNSDEHYPVRKFVNSRWKESGRLWRSL